MIEAAAAILAGGRARRFGGRDKALVDVDGETVLARQLRAVGGLVGSIVVVARDPDPFRDYPVQVVADRHPGAGPLAGLDAALAATGAPHIVALGCDMPDVSPRVLELLLSRAADADLVVPVAGGSLQPLCAVYGARVAPVIAARIAAGALRAVDLPGAAERAGLSVVYVGEAELTVVDPQLRCFANLNTPADRARRKP